MLSEEIGRITLLDIELKSLRNLPFPVRKSHESKKQAMGFQFPFNAMKPSKEGQTREKGCQTAICGENVFLS